jgi:hypothetical protein
MAGMSLRVVRTPPAGVPALLRVISPYAVRVQKRSGPATNYLPKFSSRLAIAAATDP